MKTISDYTIYCTLEQTKKAFELGAPINTIKKPNTKVYLTERITAEQMINWLEEQDIYINILWDDSLYTASIFHTDKGKIGVNKIFTSRKEATLSAINTALEYLIKGGKE